MNHWTPEQMQLLSAWGNRPSVHDVEAAVETERIKEVARTVYGGEARHLLHRTYHGLMSLTYRGRK